MYGVLPSLAATPWGAEGMASAATLMADVDRTQRERARETFDRVASQGPLTWCEAEGDTLLASLLERALCSDLVVVGQHDATDTRTGALPGDLVPALVTDSGKPTLVVPYAGSFDAMGQQVLLAWKPTREAARAATAALPWLRTARQINLASQLESRDTDDPSFARLEHWLRLHGVTAPVQHHRLGPIEVGEGLLSLGADTSADLLVMGCYGHSRTREWVLGGATRTVLRAMTLPVLMVH